MRELSGRPFECVTPTVKRPLNLDDLHRRHQEYGVEACEAVAADRAREWAGSRMAEYYRPSTIFRPSHFPEYLAAARAAKAATCSHGSTSCPWCCRAHGRVGCPECDAARVR